MNVQNKEQGFTIIEVVLVLAIAGLIFLMVFIALPTLQKNQRDTQRRSDIGTFKAQINQYQANNKGEIPNSGCAAATPKTAAWFVAQYLATNWNDPQTGTTYTCATAVPTASGSYHYRPGTICNGEAATTAGASSRNYSVVMKLEG